MLRFVLQKIRSKKWLIASLLVGNLLLTAIAAATPMYTKAALQRMLTRTMNDYVQENNRYPTTVSVLSSSSLAGHEKLMEDAAVVEDLSAALGVEPTTVVYNRYGLNVSLLPELKRNSSRGIPVRIGAMAGLADHVEIVSGSMFSRQPDEDGVYDVIVSEACLIELGLIRGEILNAEKAVTAAGKPLRVRIAGVFRANDTDPQYWYQPPSYYKEELFLPEELLDEALEPQQLQDNERALWYWIFDYNDLTVDNCGQIAAASAKVSEHFADSNHHSYSDAFSDLVAQYEVDAARVRATLRILQVPIYVLLAAFIFMVTRQMLEIEGAEIAVIKSRGASRKQILGIYTLQSGLLALASLVLGIPLAMLVCQIIGSSNAFLEFVSRSALRLQITWEVLLYGLAAAALGMAAMVLPVIGRSRTTIVSAKQSKARKKGAPLWQKLFLDVLLIAAGLYGCYSFRGQEELITEKVHSGAGLDPLIYLASSLFIVGCGLLALRVIPLIVRVVYRIGRRRWSPPLYASYLWVMRSGRGGYIMTFLVVTIALGIFSASIARTVNSNETDRIVYTDGGADVVMMEKWNDNSALVGADSTGQTKLSYIEPDFPKYLAIPGVESATRVYYDAGASVALLRSERDTTVTVMGIHTREFGQTASFKDGLLPAHFYEYLNAISQKSDAVLVSSKFREKCGLQLGDTLNYKNSHGENARGVIYGFIDYWPAYKSTSPVWGTGHDADNLLIVANLGYLQAQWGVLPYQVWLRMEDGNTDPVYDFVSEQKLTLTLFRDQTADLVAMKNDPGIQGTNGILTVGFVVALVLCTVGFLIYWILAIRNRSLQFGVFRAMGLSMKEIVVMLLNEQFYVSGLSIAFGVGAGVLASKLFVPLVQLAYVRAETPLPLEVLLAGSDVLRLLLVVLLVMAVCMGILWAIIRRMKIDQALKLGED